MTSTDFDASRADASPESPPPVLDAWHAPPTRAVRLHADASLYAGLFDGTELTTLTLEPARKAYVHLVRGQLSVNGQRLSGGDAALIEQESRIRLDGGQDAEVLVFDLAA